MIDFSALALGPGVAIFARPVSIRPVRSQPGKPAYAARGVWAAKPVEIHTEGDRVLNTRILTLGIRLAEFPIPPKTRDLVDVPAAGSLPAEGPHWIEDIDEDGQGGASLILKQGAPPKASGTP